MPRWNEKSHVTPTINVNLDRSCYCERLGIGADPHHVASCPAKPILIPCHIPRSVTVTVRLPQRCPTHPHNGGVCEPMPDDPARCVYGEHPTPRPIRVSCSIAGRTWEESEASEVTDIDIPENLVSADVIDPIANACRARWSLVKALLLHRGGVAGDHFWNEKNLPLLTQRDNVFAAIADMARAEAARTQAWIALPLELRKGPGPTSLAGEVLERYVARLIEQVGILGVEP